MARKYRRRGQWKNNPNVQRGIGILLELGIQAAHRAKEKVAQARTGTNYKPAPESTPAPLPQRYGSTGEKTAVGIVKIAAGSLFGSLSLLSIIAGLIALLAGKGIFTFLLTLGLFGGCMGLAVSGIRDLCMLSRFRNYCQILGQKTHCSLEHLSKTTGRQEALIRKDLKKMIQQGLFLEGHMDQEEATLITSHETYRHFEESRLAYERQKHLEAQEESAAQQKAAEKEREAAARDPRIQSILSQGEVFITEIRRCNNAIPGQEISAKLTRMELILRKIFHRLEADPDIAEDLKRMMDYYLPMTVKLLQTYVDMDAQPIQGQTITASKQEIEQTLDTLNLAFEKLLDSIFQETALDVSSDISVLQTLLAQEGLTEDPLAQIRKQTTPNHS